jgi:hypothetical protein
MRLVVVHPVLLAAVDGDAAVRTFEVYMCGWGTGGGRLARFKVEWVGGYAGWGVGGVRAVCVLAHIRRALADLGDGRLGEGVEEVVFCEDIFALVALWVYVFERFERFAKLLASG